MRHLTVVLVAAALSASPVSPAAAQTSYQLFESGLVRPLALSPDGTRLFAVNTPDGVLEIFDVDVAGVTKAASVPVGLEPVAVAARTNSEVWVVNHLSDSVSIVDVSGTPRVVRTLLVGDEPNDIVFAGSGGNRAFISTAHRGQNSPFPRAQHDTQGVGRADVWVFDALNLGTSMGGDELTVITLFTDKPRALAVSPDGSSVYAAGFHTGNQTTTILENVICNTSGFNLNNDIVQPGCSISGNSVPGGTPPPHQNDEGINRPETGLIVRANRDGASPGVFSDELGRDWTALVNFNLPDEDVFEIDADANPPAQTDVFAEVGTVLFNMVANPVSGAVYVSNTESRNEVRFEGPGNHATGIKPAGEPTTVRGHLAEARITVIDAGVVTPRHLNKHIPYGAVPVPAGIEEDSLATPVEMAVSADGATLYVAAFGSQKIGVFDTAQLEADTFTPDSNDHITLSGGGPAGVVLDGARLYTLTRFNNSVVVVDLTLGSVGQEIQSVPLHNPEPASVVDGRPFLYDAVVTGSNGESSCASCHIFGDMDDLAWDLGNPDDEEVDNLNGFRTGPGSFVFHPMKGPMTTQSLRGLANMGPQHWRGDRQGDEDAAFNGFNVAFPGLVGRDEGELTTGQMQAFTDFALQIRYPPNPIRQLDNSLRTDEAAGLTLYNGRTTDGFGDCNSCHVINAASGFFGGDALSSVEGLSQEFKIPHLRNQYQKIGMFGLVANPGLGGPTTHQGDQIRGFGFLHDGSIDNVFRFLSSDTFDVNDTEQENLEALMMAFPTDLPPIVGQQITRTSTNGATVDARIDLMLTMAGTPYPSEILGAGSRHCDVIAKSNLAGVQRGAVRLQFGLFQPDDGSAPVPEATIRALSNTAGQETTYTCVPFGSGVRMGVDRDEDTVFNAVDNCPDVPNPGQADSNTNGIGDACDSGGGPTTTTTVTTTTTSTSTTTMGGGSGVFITRSLKISKLTKPAGEQKLSLKSDEIDGTGIFYTPLSEVLSISLEVGGNVVRTTTIAAFDPGWKATSKSFKWKAKTPHPDGLKSVSVGLSGEPFKVKIKAKDIDAVAAAGVAQFDITFTIGDDSWTGPTPPCELAGSGSSLKCR